MCCSAARLFAALVTFTIGTLVAIPFLNQPTKVLPTVEKYDGYICSAFRVPKQSLSGSEKRNPADEKQKLFEEFANYEISGSDKPYEKAIQKWLNGEELTQYVSLVTLKEPDENEPINATAEINLLNINENEHKELTIKAFCAHSGGNCGEVRIYKRNDFEPQILLKASMVQDVKVLKTKTKGSYDLNLITWNTGYEYHHRVFKFDGYEYKAKKCWFETNEVKGKLLKRPIITPVKCGEYDYVD